MVKISSKSEVFDFSGVLKPPIRGLIIIERSWNYGNPPYLAANPCGLNFIKIGCIWIFRGGRSPLLGGGGGLHVTCDAKFRICLSYTSQKSCVNIWFGLVEPVKSYCGNRSGRGGGLQEPPIRGLRVTCDGHLRTWLSYSSQKPCVKIWFRLVEPFQSYHGNNQIFVGGETPY